MTIIRILLIIGLVYVALQQKKESTRNVILVVTGLLAFCMMSKEGFGLSFVRGTPGDPTTDTIDGWIGQGTMGTSAAPDIHPQITDTNSNTTFVFDLSDTVGTQQDIYVGPPDPMTLAGNRRPPTEIICNVDGVVGAVAYQPHQADYSSASIVSSSKITDYLTCQFPCGDTIPRLRDTSCGQGKIYNQDSSSISYSGDYRTSGDYKSKCCKFVASVDSDPVQASVGQATGSASATEGCTVVGGTTAEETAEATTCTLTAADADADPVVTGSCARATGSGSCTYVAGENELDVRESIDYRYPVGALILALVLLLVMAGARYLTNLDDAGGAPVLAHAAYIRTQQAAAAAAAAAAAPALQRP